jgi:sulfatase maturation enzyme AslB (radical SAM superfamily)
VTSALAPSTLCVILSSDCNLRCAYCYQNAKHAGVMRWPVLRRALDMLLDSEHRSPQVFFVGGEPLLAFDLVRRAVRYVETRRRPGTTPRYEIATNGLLLGTREIRFLEARAFHVQLSLDGAQTAQDLRAPGTFETLDKLVDRLRAGHPALFSRLEVALIVTPESAKYLGDSVTYLLGKGVREFAAAPALNGQSRWTPALHATLDRQFARAFEACRTHYHRTGLMPFRSLQPIRVPARADDWFCGVRSGESLTVDVDGTLTGCVTFARSCQRFPATPLGRALGSLQIGHISRPDLSRRLVAYARRVEDTGLFNNRRRKHSASRRCGTCRHLAECTVCPAAIVLGGTSDPDRIPDLVCSFNRVSAKYRARFAQLEPPGGRRLPAGVARDLEDTIVRHLTALVRGRQRRRTSRPS